ncbi:kinesin, putative [Bodo saltans]|uniref:Kinesin, putative n=1 Tax=Bodo saltans TaxID=75058 RepID=A0A0S4JBF8_BODSA|nr:kinesin, putative [Bodo saltans]|eukprot:CUG87423.1 kinesin, putative [Bodo saltans]
MGRPRFLKVIACVPAEYDIAHQTVEDVLQLPKLQQNRLGHDRRGMDVELLHSRDPIGALAMASKIAVLTSQRSADDDDAVTSSSSPTNRECRENTSVVLGKLSSRYLLVPTVPSRSLVESFVSRDARRGAAADVILTIGLFAFPAQSLQQEPPLSLAVPLATSTRLIEQHSLQAAARERAAVSLESYLPAGGLRIGRQRYFEDGFVEIRSVVEYDALIDALFHSPSFQRVLPFCSVQVVLKRVLPERSSSLPMGADRGRPVMAPLALDTLWLLAPRHAAEFASTRTTHHPTVVTQSTRHYSVGPAAHCAAPHIASVMITATSMRDLLDQSSWVHDVVLGGSVASSKYFTPVEETYSDSTWLLAQPQRQPYHQDQQQTAERAGADDVRRARDAQSLQEELFVDPTAATIATLGTELERLGKQLDAGESTFQKSLATRTTEAARLKRSKDQLSELSVTLEQQRAAKEEADKRRKELVIDLTSLRGDVASLQRGLEQLVVQMQNAQELQSKSAMTIEERRSALAAQHAQEMTQLSRDIKKEAAQVEQSLRSDERHHHEIIASEIAHLNEVHASKHLEWKQHEAALTKGMSTDAESLVSLDALAKQLTTVEHYKEKLLHQLRGMISAEHATIAATGGPLQQVVEAHATLCDEAEREVHLQERRFKERTDALTSLQAAATQNHADIDLLGKDVSEATASRKFRTSNLHDDAVAVWWDMFASLVEMERDHRTRIDALESSGRSSWLMQESDSWVNALHSSEMRFTEEARERCHEDVFGIRTRIKQWETQCEETRQHRDRCVARTEATRSKHMALRDELLGHLESIRGEEHNLLMFLEGKPMASTGATFPTLEEDQRQVTSSIERLRAALATGTVVRIRGEVSKKQQRGAFAAQLSKNLHLTVQDMIQRVESLTAHAREAQSESEDLLRGASSRLQVMESELEERKIILQRVVDQTAGVEKDLREVTSDAASASEEILARKSRHEAARRQLQTDFIAARETAMLHRAEGHAHIRKLEQEEETLTEKLVAATKSLRDLEDLRNDLELQNPQATKDALELRIQREISRQDELQTILEIEMQAASTVLRQQQQQQKPPIAMSIGDAGFNADMLSLLSNTNPLLPQAAAATPFRIHRASFDDASSSQLPQQHTHLMSPSL